MLSESNIDVTIVICTRNRASRLHLVLDALSHIKSDWSWDVLMVDNASTDNTAEVIHSYKGLAGRLQYAKADRVGLGAARDYAWRRARGEILAFTDDDCYPAPDFVDALKGVFEQHPDVALVGGRVLLHDPLDVPMAIELRDVPLDRQPHCYLESASFHGANMAIRKSALEAVGGFDVDLGAGTAFPCEDIDVAAAIAWAGFRTRFDPAPVVSHHHGRRDADLAALWKGYDAGRGAYYAKYLMRKDSRGAYLKGWGKRLMSHRGYRDVVQFTRELRAGFAFLRAKGRYDFIAVAMPIALGSLVLVSAVAAARQTKRGLFLLLAR